MATDNGTPLLSISSQTSEAGKEEKKKTNNQRKRGRDGHDGVCTRCGTFLPEGYTYVRCAACRVQAKGYSKTQRDKARNNGICTMCKTRPIRPGKSNCEPCFEYGQCYNQKRRELAINAQKPDQAMREVDQESGEEKEPRPQEVQESDGQEHIKTDSGVADQADKIASGFGTDRMEINYLID
ncbi:hypothetical protein PG984_009760 [Apiospora sp. TS-2023a]